MELSLVAKPSTGLASSSKRIAGPSILATFFQRRTWEVAQPRSPGVSSRVLSTLSYHVPLPTYLRLRAVFHVFVTSLRGIGSLAPFVASKRPMSMHTSGCMSIMPFQRMDIRSQRSYLLLKLTTFIGMRPFGHGSYSLSLASTFAFKFALGF